MSSDCKRKLVCSICKKSHPSVMHIHFNSNNSNNCVENQIPLTSGNNDINSGASTSTSLCSISNSNKKKVLCPIVPVKIRTDHSNYVIVNCALDSCSTDCWMNEGVLEKLGLRFSAPKYTVSKNTMGNKNHSNSSRVVNNLKVSDLEGNHEINVPVVFTQHDSAWPFSKEDVAKQRETEQYEHLRDVPFKFLDENVGLLLGVNIPSVMKQLEIVDGSPDDPFASRHLLGWVVNGPVNSSSRRKLCNRVTINNDDFDARVEKLFCEDFKDSSTEKELSINDKKWIDSVDKSLIKLPNGHFQADLPLKSEANFPSNKDQIYNQFLLTKKRLMKDETLFDEYSKFMNTMIDRGFVEKIPEHEIPANEGESWYLPHHAVRHKKKGKLRIVFNCAMKYRGISLNDNLLAGPDLANNLFGVLLRFRQAPAGIFFRSSMTTRSYS